MKHEIKVLGRGYQRYRIDLSMGASSNPFPAVLPEMQGVEKHKMKIVSHTLLSLAAVTLAAPILAQASDREMRKEVPDRHEQDMKSAVASESEYSRRKSRGYLEEIIVTAQKRVERLQDVPISITAITEQVLERTGADQFSEYIAQTPGAFYSDAGQGRSRINIRGLQTTNSVQFEEGQSPTAIYIDDLPSLATSNPWAKSDLRLYDIARVEILRGPQGTLFGSGALGGAVRILTNKPNFREASAGLEVGMESTEEGEESWSFNSRINLPLVQDKLALRAVGYWKSDGGWVDNTFRRERNVNRDESKGGRILLGYHPTEDVSFRLSVLYQQDSSDDRSAVNFSQSGPYEYGGWTPAYTDNELASFNFNAEVDLGSVLVTSSTTYADNNANLGQGLGHATHYLYNWRTSPDSTFGEINKFTTETWAQELRLTSQHTGRVQWIVGGFYMKQDLGQNQNWFSSTVFARTGSTTLGAWFVPAESEEMALFGEVDVGLTRTISAIVGARLFDYSFQRHNATAFGILADPGAQYPTPIKKIDETGVTPKVALRYTPSDNMMIYVQAARGFRIGQPNYAGGLTDANNGFVFPVGSKSDRLWNYEFGVKSSLLDGELRTNAALFYIDWKDVQLLRGNPLPNPALACCFTDNPGNATSKGAEVEIEYMPTDFLTFGSSHSFADAEIRSVEAGATVRPGSRLPGTPKYWSSNYIQFSSESLVRQADAYLRISHRYSGEVLSTINNLTALETDSYDVLDARAGLAFGRYEIALHVNNITNDDAIVSGGRDRSASGVEVGGGSVYRLRPRTVGITLRANF